jgi:hypothetical protein
MYQALGEQQENDIQALPDQYESRSFSTDPTFILPFMKRHQTFIINEDYSLEQPDSHPSTKNNTLYNPKVSLKSVKKPYLSYHILER